MRARAGRAARQRGRGDGRELAPVVLRVSEVVPLVLRVSEAEGMREVGRSCCASARPRGWARARPARAARERGGGVARGRAARAARNRRRWDERGHAARAARQRCRGDGREDVPLVLRVSEPEGLREDASARALPRAAHLLEFIEFCEYLAGVEHTMQIAFH